MIKLKITGKLIKKTFFTLLISCFILIGNTKTNAGLIENQLNQLPSDNNSNYKISFLNKGQVLTNYLGTAKSVLALDSNVIFWRSNNGKPYFYSTKYQGYFNSFSSCDELTGGSTIPTNCSEISFTTGSLEIFRNFFSKVAIGDYSYYRYSPYYNAGVNCTSRNFGIEVCFSSHEIGNTLCFRRAECSNGCQNGYYFCQDWCKNRGGCGGGLVDSLELTDLDFGNMSYSLIGPAPGQAGYNGNRDNESNTNTNTNNNYACPTIAQVMQNMGNNYNTGLCYNNTLYFNGTSFEQIDQEDIFTIFNNDYQNYVNRISIYRNNCTNANTTQACQNAFSGEYKKYSIIANAINGGVDEKKLRNYCNMGLNLDPNATTCVASGGGIKETYTNEEIIDEIINNGIIPTPTNTTTGEDNNVLNTLTECENGDRDCYMNNRNFIESLANIYGKITGLFKERKNVDGIIPEYILRITFMTILFTVIFKK